LSFVLFVEKIYLCTKITVMAAIAGIKYTNNPNSNKHFVHIDLSVHGNNQLLEDFLDGLDAMARQGEPTYPFDEVMKAEFERRGLKYDV
jgi:hypothetical protein